MAVVINDFEVVAEPVAPNQAGAAPAAQGAAQPSIPTPREIGQMVRRQLERLARVKAH